VDDKAILGWGVIRSNPWHLAGIFRMETEAAGLQTELGGAYAVHYGYGFKGSQDFFWAGGEGRRR
jgi:hypothetical protein